MLMPKATKIMRENHPPRTISEPGGKSSVNGGDVRRRASFCTNYNIIPLLVNCWAPHRGGKDQI